MIDAIDVAQIQRRARADYLCGAVSPTYELDVVEATKWLNEALSTEVLSMLRYRQNASAIAGFTAGVLSEKFLSYSNQDLESVDKLSKRISELGGEPGLDPTHYDKKFVPFHTVSAVEEMIVENLVTTRAMIEIYRKLIAHFGHQDPTTRRILEDILAVKEDHANGLSHFISECADFGKKVLGQH